MRSFTHARRALAVLGLCLAVLAGSAAPALASPSTDEGAFLTQLNQERQRRGLTPLVLDNPLAATARDWSQTMAARNQLSHDPGLAADATAVEPSWRRVAENVGVGYSVQSLHDAFMGSSGHRANILGPYNRVGIGVVHSGGKIWVTVRFLEGPAIAGTTGLGPPPGVATALHGDFNGDGRGDLLTYGPGSATDELWFGNTNRTMTKRSVAVAGHYRPVAGDFDGNGTTDVLWYAPGDTTDILWTWNGTGWSPRSVTVNGTYAPLTGDFDGDGRDDILWYGPGAGADVFWYGNANGSFTTVKTAVAGTYRPVTGNFDGRHGDDVFWYGLGTAADYIWYSTGARGGVTTVKQSVAGSYKPLAGDFDGNGTDDVFWYAPGASQDATWYMGTTQGAHRLVLRTVNGSSYLPASDDFDDNVADDIVWFTPSSAAGDPMWWSAPGSTGASPSTVS
jgi:hypothetical protein